MLSAGTHPRTQDSGYTLLRGPITVPGLRTLLQPTSTRSPRMAPNFFRPVSICSAPSFTVTRVLSDFTLEVMEPAPMWLPQPRMESPT